MEPKQKSETTIKHKMIISKSVEVAARNVCAWLNGPGVDVEVTSMLQTVSMGRVYTTIFWTKSSSESVSSTKSSKKRRPVTGEMRTKRFPLKIDKLPSQVLDAITRLRENGHTWQDISERSTLPYSPRWATVKGGFVDWEKVSEEAIRAFPERRIPATNLSRWYDLRRLQNQPV